MIQELLKIEVFGDPDQKQMPSHWSIEGRLAELLDDPDKMEMAEAIKAVLKKATLRAVAQLQ